MNREDIIRMAREACMALSDKQAVGGNLWYWPMEYQEKPAYREALERFFHAAYAAGAAAEREAIMDEWSACVQSDLENGVRWLNEQAAKKWQESYPAMAGFADKIYARGETK